MKPENKARVLNLIIDGGMDQSHSMLEITASLQQVLCRKVVLGIIIGAWGVGISIYRTLEAVLKGADLTIYILFNELNDFLNVKIVVKQEEIYVQVDGRSENAKKYVLVECLEYLVCKRLAKVFAFFRC